MAQAVESDVKQLVLLNGTFGPREVQKIAGAIAVDFSQYRVLREAVAELDSREDHSPASMVRLGVCQYLLGRYQRSVESLKKGDGGAMARFYLGKAYYALEQFDQALENYGAARQAGYNADDVALAQAEALRGASRAPQALQTLDNLSGAVEQTAEYLYQRGATVAAIGGNPTEVVALYERAVESDRNHAGALFGLAMENDRRGNDDQAVELYKRSVSRFPPHLGALVNLGILYEDRDQYDRALQCYQRVLDAFPAHPRARLFVKDALASSEMYYDEDAQKRRDRMSQVLNIPVTDFELSVRSRNCLQEMLASKGLKLGQLAAEKRAAEIFEPEALSADEQALLARPISDLNLSVRARKCMTRLGISTVGELIRRSGDELLECKNFGVTSLNEVRDKLAQHSLKLRGD